MVDVGYFVDDRLIIPDEIKNMTREERQAEIARLEAEIKEKHDRLRREKELTAV